VRVSAQVSENPVLHFVVFELLQGPDIIRRKGVVDPEKLEMRSHQSLRLGESPGDRSFFGGSEKKVPRHGLALIDLLPLI